MVPTGTKLVPGGYCIGIPRGGEGGVIGGGYRGWVIGGGVMLLGGLREGGW